MIRPLLQEDELLADIESARSVTDRFHVWWLGQSGFLLQWQGHQLLFDPYLSDSLTRKYATTNKPHVRMTERVIDPARLTGILAATSTHNHTDHLDAETLLPLLQSNPAMELVVPEANRTFVADRLRVLTEMPRGLDAGQNTLVGPFRLHGVPAAHEQLEKDEYGRHHFLGYVVEFGPYRVYHSGDTVRFPGMEDWLQRWNIDLALLPINGRAPERRVSGNLWGHEAAQLAADTGIKCVIPCHYEMFDFNTASPQEFIETCTKLNQHHAVLRAGERWSSQPA
jgi:L-ascorbate metabolism protein UlaG (beta-lactamase superfamily)